MKSSIIAMSVAAMLAFGFANAAPTAAPAAAQAKPATAQQTKMGDCARANKGKKGADYKAAMSACLKGGAAAPAAAAPAAAAPAAAPMAAAAPAAAAPTTQQDKMKSCNADAGKQKLKGAARKSFMSSCVKKAA